MRWRDGHGAWRRRHRHAPDVAIATDLEMQRAVLVVVLREHPTLLTFPTLASELFENPSELLVGLALARAVRDLVLAGLLCSDGMLVVPSLSALHFKRLHEHDPMRPVRQRKGGV